MNIPLVVLDEVENTFDHVVENVGDELIIYLIISKMIT